MILDKITLLNQTVLECLNETSELKIVKKFTDVGILTLEADFGFVWLNSAKSNDLELVYHTPNLPFTPNPPREGGRNYSAIKNATPNFVPRTEKVKDADYVRKYVASFVIIPLVYKKAVYGTMVLCYKNHEPFPKDKKIISVFIGNSVAQAITIHRLVETKIYLEQEKTKVEFMANATHELRTPLAIMRGNVDLALMNEKDSKGAIEALKNIRAEINILSSIMNDMAILVAGQGARSKIRQRSVDLSIVLHRVTKRVKILAEKKNIEIKIKESSTPLVVFGDEQYLEEKLFLNLVKNAITYGKHNGHILIEMSKTKKEAVVKIKDDGIGIPKEELPKIFGRFYRVNKARTHAQDEGRSGLGLAIVKWVVEKHKGAVSAQSVEGKGSTFTVNLPLMLK
jgi:K+-sensing histidine kinase KdpD